MEAGAAVSGAVCVTGAAGSTAGAAGATGTLTKGCGGAAAAKGRDVSCGAAGAGCGFHRCPLHHLGRLGQAEEGKFQLDALVAAAGHVFEGVAQCADGPDGLLLAQLRPFSR